MPEIALEQCEGFPIEKGTFSFKEDEIQEKDEEKHELRGTPHVTVRRAISKEMEERAKKVYDRLDKETLKDLNEEEITHIKGIIEDFAHVFGLLGENLKATTLIKHKIPTTTDVPIKVKRYRPPQVLKEKMQEMIDELMQADIVQKSTSPYTVSLKLEEV